MKKRLFSMLGLMTVGFGMLAAYAMPFDIFHQSAIVYHALSYEKLGEATSFQFKDGQLRFTWGDYSYFFEVTRCGQKLGVTDALPEAVVSSGTNEGLRCTVVQNREKLCINISPEQGMQPDALYNNKENLMILIGGKQETSSAFGRTISIPTVQSIKQKNMQTARQLGAPYLGGPPLAAGKTPLHVLAEGISVPFLVKAGYAEGFAVSSHAYSDKYLVRVCQYAVQPVLPGDGIRLFSQYWTQPSVIAWSSPAWPSPGMQSVDVSAEISVLEGRFLAQTHYVALDGKIPLLFPIYDDCGIG